MMAKKINRKFRKIFLLLILIIIFVFIALSPLYRTSSQFIKCNDNNNIVFTIFSNIEMNDEYAKVLLKYKFEFDYAVAKEKIYNSFQDNIEVENEKNRFSVESVFSHMEFKENNEVKIFVSYTLKDNLLRENKYIFETISYSIDINKCKFMKNS